MPKASVEKQNITVSLSREVLKKTKMLTARRETSISGLLAQEIEALVSEGEAYERAQRQAIALLERGFHWEEPFTSPEKKSMSGKTFVDTNVLIYAYDIDANEKHQAQ